jgi:hypothetical protein
MGYRGWHAVTDPKGVIIAVTFCPVEDGKGFLAVLFVGGSTACHEGVPLAKYKAIIKVPYALHYYHQQIKNLYLRVGDVVVPPFQMTENGARMKESQQAKERLDAVPGLARSAISELNLFGEEISGPTKKSAASSKRH